MYSYVTRCVRMCVHVVCGPGCQPSYGGPNNIPRGLVLCGVAILTADHVVEPPSRPTTGLSMLMKCIHNTRTVG